MDIEPFTPNYLRKNNAYAKNQNGHEEKPEPAKKRVEIPNAIKTADEVEERIKETIKGTRKAGRPKGSKNKTKRGIV